MFAKIKRTTFGVVSSHIISTTFLFPILWLIAGSLAKALLLAQGMIDEPIATTSYYVIMLGCFYLGTKYSLYYIDKRVSVALPKQSGRQSIIVFSILVILTNITLFYFEKAMNIQRVIFSLLLIYMFAQLTKRYFNSLEQTEYIECNFLFQIIVLLANLSMFVLLLFIYAIFHELNPIAHLIALTIAFYIGIAVKSFDKLFVPFFYLPNEPKPIKKALFILSTTLPVNIAIWIFILRYFESRYVF